MDDLNLYRSDFDLITQVRDLLAKDLGKYAQYPLDQPIRHDSTLTDGRQMRIVFPHGPHPFLEQMQKSSEEISTEVQSEKTPKHSDCLAFVGFFGQMAENVDEDVLKKCWALDQMLIKELEKIDGILWYVSMEASVGGDWFNFVLLRDLETIDDWHKVDIHKSAMVDISPVYYNKIRIHAGLLQGGLHFQGFSVDHTIFLDYSNYQHSGHIARNVTAWSKQPCGPEVQNISSP